MLDGRFTQGSPQQVAAKQRLALPPRFRDRLTMSPAEVARLLGDSDQFVLDLCGSKELLYKAYGDRLFIDVQSLLNWLDSGEVEEILFDEE
jgi:hypothetical protein